MKIFTLFSRIAQPFNQILKAITTHDYNLRVIAFSLDIAVIQNINWLFSRARTGSSSLNYPIGQRITGLILRTTSTNGCNGFVMKFVKC